VRFINIDYNGMINNKKPFFANGTSLIETIEASYQKLVDTFGKPNVDDFDNYKSDAEWLIFTPNGVATIYNYKDGKNYLGKEGLEVEEITNWHIGGHNEAVVGWIKKALNIF